MRLVLSLVRVNMFCVLLLVSLLGVVRSLTNIEIKGDGIGNLTTFKIEQGFFNLTVDPLLFNKKYFVLELVAPREVVLLYGGPRDLKLVGSGLGSIIHVSQMSEIADHIKSPAGFRVQVKQPQEAHTDQSFDVTLKMSILDHVLLTGNHTQKFFLHEINELPLEYIVSADQTSYKTRFQISSPHLGEPALLAAFVNFNKQEFPSAETHDFKLHHIDGHKLAFMASKDNKEAEFFCKYEKDRVCTYRMILKVENKHLPWIFLDAHHVPVREPILIGKQYYDFYPRFGFRIYLVDISNPTFAGKSIKVRLNTIHGSPSLFVNPEFVPEFVDKSVWKSTDATSGFESKSISIPPTDRMSKLHNISILYIMVNANEPSSYMLQVDGVSVDKESIEKLALHEIETVIMPFQTVKNFEITVSRVSQNNEKSSETQNSQIKIDAKQLGDGKLDIFGFLRTPNSQPTLSLEELMASNSSTTKLSHFVKNDQSIVDKSIELNFLCDGKTAFESRVVDHKLTEHICLVTVAAVVWSPYKLSGPGTQLTASTAKFRIYAHSKTSHQRLYWNHAQTIKLAEGEKKLLQINFHQGQSTGIDSVKARLQMIYGNVRVHLGLTSGKECEHEDTRHMSVALEGRQHSELLVNNDSPIKLGDISGVVYVCLAASSMSEITMEFTTALQPEFHNTGNFQLSLTRNIAPDEHLTGEITNLKEPLTFRFHANLEKQFQMDKSEAFIKIHITPLKGNNLYRIVASNSGQLPTPTQGFWNTVGDTLIISSTDQNFKPISEYLVAIYAMPDPVSRDDRSVRTFTVTHTIGSRHVVLRPGQVFSTEIGTLHHPSFLKALLPPGTKNMTFLKSTVSAVDYEVSFSFDLKNQYPFVQNSNINIPLGLWGVFLDQSKLKVYCPQIATETCTMFIGLRSFAPSVNPMVVYTFDEHPVTLRDETIMMIPAPLKSGIQLSFVYHIPVERIKDKFTLSQQLYMNPYTVYVDFVTEAELATKTKFSDFPDAVRNRISREAAVINEIEIDQSLFVDKPVALITLASLQNPIWGMTWGSEGLVFSFQYAGKLNTVHHVSELQPGVRYVMDSKNNSRTWQYFKFHHSTGDNILISIENLANSCWLSVAKSKEIRPTNVKYLARSFSNLEDDVTISPEMLPPGERIQGHYFISVYCLKAESKFSLLYRPDCGNYLHVYLNSVTPVKLYKDKENYIELANIHSMQDIKIGMKCVKSTLQVYVKSIKPEDFSKSMDPEARASFRPTITSYHYKAASRGAGGLTFLTIPTNSEFYCETCKFIMLIETDQDEKVDLLIRKTFPMQTVTMMDGKELMGQVNFNESDLYSIWTPAFASVDALQLRAIQGKVTLYYSSSLAFPPGQTTVINQFQPDEQFRLTFDPKKAYPGVPFGVASQKFIKIVGASNVPSEYTITYMQNNQVEQLSPTITQKVSMGSEFTRYFYFPANTNYTAEVKLTLAYMWNGNFLNFNDVRTLLPKFLTFYYVDNYMQIFSKRYSRRLEPASSDMFNHQLTYRLHPSGNGSVPNGYVVVKVDNRIRKPLSLLLELALGADRYLQKLHTTAEMLNSEQKNLTYHINVEETDRMVQLDINQCLKGINAYYSFEPINSAGKSPAMEPKLLYDEHFSQRFIYLSQRGRLSITFSKPTEKPSSDKLLSPWQASIPHIFTFSFNLNSQSSIESDSLDFSSVVSVKKDSHYVMILDGSVRVPKVEIQNLSRILQTHSIHVNYTLYLSPDEKMTSFISKCHGYGITYAEQYFDTSTHYSVSKWETITNESFAQQQKLISESVVASIKNTLDYVTLRPRVYGYGDIFKATVIAKVIFISRSDTATFPVGQQVEVSYGEFEIKGDKYGFIILGTVTFLAVLLLALCMAVCIRHGIIKPLFSRKFLSAFDTQAVADQLILEIADYRENMRNKASNESANSSTAVLNESLVEGESRVEASLELTTQIGEEPTEAGLN